MQDDPLHVLVADVLVTDPGLIDEDSGVGRTENWDSLRNLMVMAEVERVYAIKIPFKAYTEATTVRSIRALITPARP